MRKLKMKQWRGNMNSLAGQQGGLQRAPPPVVWTGRSLESAGGNRKMILKTKTLTFKLNVKLN